MSQELENVHLDINRRSFIKKSIIAMAGMATLATLSKKLTYPPIKGFSPRPTDTQSIFTPRVGSKLGYWRNKFNSIRLK